MDDHYKSVVRLMLDVAPIVFRSGAFVMKGGTAINMFVQNMPRLSVDIDLVYVNSEKGRDDSLQEIANELDQIRETFRTRGLDAPPARTMADERRLLVSKGATAVKIEVNTVFRGTVLKPVQGTLCENAKSMFRRTLKAPLLATEELYAGKLVAALDRQHPRDLYDVMKLRESGGINDLTRSVFVAYLTAHNRPINELLTPNKLDIAAAYTNDFVGMTIDPVSLEDLLEVREWLFETLPASLTEAERRYLLSIKAAEPVWALLPFEGLRNLPAIRWKLMNIERLKASNPKKHRVMLNMLEAKLAALPSVPATEGRLR